MKRRIWIGLFSILLLAGPVFAAEGTQVSAEEGLAMLKDGNARFVAMKMEHPDVSVARREETAADGQKPFAIVLGCADSRVPVEMLFDRGIGDIFVMRVAGNIAMDSSVIGTLEYAAGHLHVPLLVVLGHTQCGAVGLAVAGTEVEGGARDILKSIAPAAEQAKAEHPELRGDALVDEAVKRNVFQTEKNLFAGSEEIRDLVAKGGLKVVPAVYDIKTGKVDWLEGK
jgi:carbonic anhydrase